MLFCEILVLFEMMIKKYWMIQWFTAKPKAAKMTRTIEKNEQNTQILQKIQKLLGFEWKII